MVSVDIFVSINASESEKANLEIPREAMEEFVGGGFINSSYEARFIYYCPPRAISPHYLQIFMTISDLASNIVFWGVAIKEIIKFCKRCRGYKPCLTIKRKDKQDVIVPLDESEDSDEIIKKIKELLK